jgi:hypothetical protein
MIPRGACTARGKRTEAKDQVDAIADAWGVLHTGRVDDDIQ